MRKDPFFKLERKLFAQHIYFLVWRFLGWLYVACQDKSRRTGQTKVCATSFSQHRTLIFISAFLLIFLTTDVFAQQSWTIDLPSVGSFSSPRVSDLNKDGVLDIIMGAGRAEFQVCDSAVIAIDGKNGNLLWNVHAKDQVFGSAIFQDITQDGVNEVFIGGRSATLMAINGETGAVVWRFISELADSSRWFNFYNPQFIIDQDEDGIPDILVANGGDVMVEPYDANRPPGYLLIISAKTGKLIAKAEMPDGRETYQSAIVLEEKDNTEIIFGSGGETVGGGLFSCQLSDVLKEDLSGAIHLDSSENKGFIGPPSRVDLNEDGILDIVTNAVDGRLLAIDGQNYQRIWEVDIPNSESYSSASIGYFNQDTIPDVFVSYGTGVWPDLKWSIQIMVNGATGAIEYKDSLGFYQNTTPLAADLNGDGIDEIVMSLNFQEVNELYQKFFYTTLIAIEFKSKEVVQIAKTYEGSNLSSTPWIGDIDQDGFLDFIYCHDTNLRQTYTFDGMKLHRIVTQIPVYKPIVWGAYQGSNYKGIFKGNQ